MIKIYLLSFLSIFIFSCTAKLRYVGQSLDPTHKVDVFVSEQSVNRPFEYIGKGYLGGIGLQNNAERIQRKAEKLGREKGADAVLIVDYFIPYNGGTDIVSTSRTDSIGEGSVTMRHTRISPSSTLGFNILYLKYKQ